MAANETIDCLEENLSKLNIAEEEILVFVGETKFTSKKHILTENSKYFEALFNFDPEKKEVSKNCYIEYIYYIYHFLNFSII